jgi:phenylalanyl-tRNA synthetase beta chain
MKVSYNWLKDYVPLDDNLDEIAEKLTLAGIEIESIDPTNTHLENVVVGLVEKKEQHPNADKLSVCEVNVGTENNLTIVCGAPNVAAGMTVPVAKIGATLPGNFKIKKAKLRGVVSKGMICSQKELDLGEDHEGIWDLGQIESTPGTLLTDALNIRRDIVFDLSITANRPDCLNAIGIARELAGVFDKKLKLPQTRLVETNTAITDLTSVTVDIAHAVPRYAARVINNVKIGASPDWLVHYLQVAGMRSINNIVDITNFVMLEMGQPLHAFDYNLLAENRIHVRYSKPGEKFTTLDEKEHTLPENTVLICDGEKPVALGGIMGGLNSEVSAQTTDILLESAYFAPFAIRSHAKKLGISTESSQRFERGADPNGVARALDRAAALMAELAGGEIAAGVVDVYPTVIEPRRITLRPEKVRQILGLDITQSDIGRLLHSIEVDYKDQVATAPTFRPDLEREIDIVEEIARLHGLDNIAAKTDLQINYAVPVHAQTAFADRLKTFLTDRHFFEVITNSMISQRENFAIEGTHSIEIMNPLSDDMQVMRSSLLPSLLKVVSHNVNRQQNDIKIFEIGRVFANSESTRTGVAESDKLGVMVTGSIFAEQWGLPRKGVDIFYLKALADELGWRLNIKNLALSETDHPMFAKPVYNLSTDGNVIGTLGRIAPAFRKIFGIDADIFAAELDLDGLLNAHNAINQYKPFSRFPFTRKDMAFVLNKEVPVEEVLQFIRNLVQPIVTHVQFFDLYEGKPLGADEKSIGFSLKFESLERTLTEDEMSSEFERVIKNVLKKFNAKLRDR